MTEQRTQILIDEIEAFLRETGMGPSYFGRAAVGNSEVVARLRRGREVLPTTEARIRKFIRARREMETRAAQAGDVAVQGGAV